MNVDGYILQGILKASDALSIDAIFSVIGPGAYPGETKMGVFDFNFTVKARREGLSASNIKNARLVRRRNTVGVAVFWGAGGRLGGAIAPFAPPRGSATDY